MIDFAFLHSNHDPHCSARVDKRFEGYFTLQFMARGGVELFYDGARYKIAGRWFWAAFPGPHIRFHAAPSHGSWEHRYVAFKGERVQRWRDDGLWPDAPQSAPTGINWEARFDELLHCARRVEKIEVLRGAHLLEGILLDLASSRQKNEAPCRAKEDTVCLEMILNDLEMEIAFAPDYARLAARYGMGLSTLRRRFREATGTPLHDYVLQKRMARARRLLGEGDLPIKAVANELGYADVYFFAAQFRRLTGVTPAAYRKSRQG
jgi:AraC-like DNA-binding protein